MMLAAIIVIVFSVVTRRAARGYQLKHDMSKL